MARRKTTERNEAPSVAPYPAHWEADVALRDGTTAHLRPITPSDAQALQRFHRAQSPQSIYFRFFAPMAELSPGDLERSAARRVGEGGGAGRSPRERR